MKFILLPLILSLTVLQNAAKAQTKPEERNGENTATVEPAKDTTLTYTLNGIGHQLSDFEKNDDYIKCGRNSNASSSYNTIIRFSCAKADTNIIGSWTVRNISPRDPNKNKPESVNIYFYDGIINFGNIDINATSHQKYELKGFATFVAGNCRENGTFGFANQYTVKIWGECGTNKINFCLRNASTEEIYASATFSSDVNVTGENNYPSITQTNLNLH